MRAERVVLTAELEELGEWLLSEGKPMQRVQAWRRSDGVTAPVPSLHAALSEVCGHRTRPFYLKDINHCPCPPKSPTPMTIALLPSPPFPSKTSVVVLVLNSPNPGTPNNYHPVGLASIP